MAYFSDAHTVERCVRPHRRYSGAELPNPRSGTTKVTKHTKKEDRGQASDSLAERVRHPTPRDVHHHDTRLFRVFRAFRGWIPACVVGETATDERDAHTVEVCASEK